MGVWRWYRHRSLFVILDPADNSVTLSRGLFDLMDVMNLEVAKVFVFHLCNAASEDLKRGGAIYAFMLNPQFEQETQLADIQCNSKHRTIGFECLCPTVNRIFYDYGLSVNSRAKLSVEPATLPSDSPEGKSYYIILPPHAKPVK
ncbi:MAG: hypothetical protein IJS63_09345 [Bacteroidaceae bacterium]|nr:hypothetical protein [Bacteroidaceae bacterium]